MVWYYHSTSPGNLVLCTLERDTRHTDLVQSAGGTELALIFGTLSAVWIKFWPDHARLRRLMQR
jgi:hypothetical protein